MTPDTIAQSIIAAAMLWAALNPRKVGRFTDECSRFEGWIRRDEMATEAQTILRVMCDGRVA